MDGFSGREIWRGELVLEPRGSDRTVAKDKNFGQDRQLKR